MELKTELKKFLPAAQQGSLSLDQFLDAVGELLDGFTQAINDFQKYNDFELLDEALLIQLGKQFDVEFPRNMSPERKRKYLREVITLYRSNGTKRSLKRIFRFIGWNVEIDEYYILNPTWFSSPTDTYTLVNDQGNTYTFGLYDKLIGQNRTYFGDLVYIDIVDPLGNVYPKQQIYGEPYPVIKPDNFVKVPYIKINVTSEDYQLFTSDYVENGKIYSYDSSEEYEILQTIKNYFLNRTRPTTVAIVEISTPFQLQDIITYTLLEQSENLISGTPLITFSSGTPFSTITRDTGSWITDGYVPEMMVTITGTTNNNRTVRIKDVTASTMTVYPDYALVNEANVSGVSIVPEGSTVTTSPTVAKYDGTMTYGSTTDRYLSGESFGGLKYGTGEMDYYSVNESAPTETITRSYQIGSSGAQKHIGIRKNSTVSLTVPSDASVYLYASKDTKYEIANGAPTWEIIDAAITNVTNQTYTLTSYFAVYINISTPSSTASIDMTITLS